MTHISEITLFDLPSFALALWPVVFVFALRFLRERQKRFGIH